MSICAKKRRKIQILISVNLTTNKFKKIGYFLLKIQLKYIYCDKNNHHMQQIAFFMTLYIQKHFERMIIMKKNHSYNFYGNFIAD